MKRKQLLLAIAAMLLPLGMMAQTLVFDEETQLEFLDDGDGRLYIDVGTTKITNINGKASNTYFITDGGLRSNWRSNIPNPNLNGQAKWYKEYLAEVTSLSIANNGPASFKGIEYFFNLETLVIPMTANSSNEFTLNLSENKKLSSLSWDLGGRTKNLIDIDVSNTQLTTVPLPDAANTKLKTYKAENSKLTGTLDLSTLSVLETVDLSNSPDLTRLTMPSVTNKIKELDLRGCTGLTYTESDPLDLTAYTNLNRFNVKVAGSGLVPGESIIFNEDLTVKYLDIIDADGEEVNLNSFTQLQRVYCYNASKLDVSACTKLKFLEVKGPSDTDLILSKDNTDLLILDVSYSGMTKLDLSGESGTGSGSKPALSLAPNLKLVACCWAPIETLDLRNHTKLEYIALKSQSGDNNSITGFTPFNSTNPEEADYTMQAFIDSCKTSANFDVKYQHNNGTSKEADDGPKVKVWDETNEKWEWVKVGYGVNGGSNSTFKTYYNAGNKLRDVNIEGCTMLKQLLVTGLWENNKKYEYTQIEKIDAFRCSKLQEIVAINGRLSTLRVRTCPKLEYLAIEQNYLDESSFAGDNGLIKVENLRKFIAHRNRFTNLDFLTMPVSGRGAEHIAKLQQIQVNGGSYVIRDPNTDEYISHLLDGDGEKGASPGKRNHKFTSTLKRFNTENLGADMRILYCGDNMLEELNLSTMPNLRKLECKNNMLLTLDLSKLRDPNELIWDPGEEGAAGKRAYKVEDASWGDQVAFLNVEVVKGKITLKKKKNEEGEDVYDEKGEPVYVVDTNDPGIKGLNDLVALHMPNGGYRHNLKGDGGAVELYPSLADELAGTNKIASEYDTHMCFIENHDNTLCPTGHSGTHLFLHTGQEIVNENSGKPKDQDLYGGVLKYKYDTQVLCDSAGYSRATPPTEEQCKSGAGTWEWEEASHGGNSGYPVLRGTGYDVFTWKKVGDTYTYVKTETVDKYVNARVHVYPYIMYVNPATRSTYQKLGVKDSVDYYSGTIYLDYAAIVPEGLEVYVAAGLATKTVGEEVVKDTTLITSNGISEAHEQLRMVKVGVAGEIIPARTPLYVKPALPSAEKQANGWSQAAAGLYAFETTWDFKLLGWEDYRGCKNVPGIPNSHEFPPKLHGPDVDNYNPETMVWRDGCDPTKNPSRWINNKEIVLEKPLDGKNTYTGQELLDKNILSGTLEDIDLTSSTSNSLGLTRRSVLVLGLESQKGTNMIGFWPQNAKKIGAHRCYITYDDAMEKLGGAPGVSVPATSVSGFKFSFADEDSFSEDVGDANGDGVVSIADVTAIINKINGVVTGKFVEKAADVNKDGIISIADVTGVINTINNQ